METIHLALASDERFAMHLCVAAASALANSNREQPYVLHVFHDGLSKETAAKVEALREIRPVEIDWKLIKAEDFKEFAIPRNLSVMANVRLKMPSMLSGVEKAIYLDCDMTVLDNLAKLWSIDLEGNAAGAVRDFGIKNRKIRRIGIQDREYFNSGMLVLDLAKLRALGFERKCAETLSGPVPTQNDQETLNLALRGNWKALPLRWNTLSSVTPEESAKNGFDRIEEVREAIASPAIVHYASFKPSSYLYDGLCREDYYRYLEMTGFRGYKVQDRNWRTLIIRHAPRSSRRSVRHFLKRFGPC